MKVLGFGAHIAPALAVLFCLLVVPASNVTAQAATSRTLVGGQTVSWAAPWSEDAELTSSGEGFDLLGLSTDLGVVGIGSYGYPIAGADVRDIAIEAFAGEIGLQQVDRGDYGNVSYSLDIAATEGRPFGVFTLVIESPGGTLLSIMLAPVQAFQSQLESAQGVITIDGEEIFNGVDAAAMQGHLDGAGTDGGPTAANPTEPAATVAAPTTAAPPPAVATSTPDSAGQGGLVGGINANLGDENPTPATGDAAPTPASGGGAGTGNVPDLPNSYTIPSSGVIVSWSDDWELSAQDQQSVDLKSPSLVAFLSVLDLGQVQNSTDAQALSTSILQQPGFEDHSLVLAKDVPGQERDIIVLSQPGSSGTIYLVYDIQFGATGATAALVTVFEEDLAMVIDAMPGSVQIDGQPAYGDFKELAPELFPAA